MVLAVRIAILLLVGLAIHLGTVAEAASTYSPRSAVAVSDETLRSQDVAVPVSGRGTRGPGGYRGGSSNRSSPGRSYSKTAKPRRSSPKQSAIRSQKNGPAAKATSGIAARRTSRNDPRTSRPTAKLSTQSGRLSGQTKLQVAAQRAQSRSGVTGTRSQKRKLSGSRKSESAPRMVRRSKGGDGSRGVHQNREPVGSLHAHRNRPSVGVRVAREQKSDNSSSRYTLMATSPRTLVGRYSGYHPSGIRAAMGANASRMGREVSVARAKRSLDQTLARNKALTANQNSKLRRVGHFLERHLKDMLNHAKAYSGNKIVIGRTGIDAWMKQYGYQKGAREAGANFFEPHPKLRGKELWEANKKFLTDAVNGGARVYLATPHRFAIGSYKGKGFYQKEIEHLENLGYVISENGLYMHRS